MRRLGAALLTLLIGACQADTGDLGQGGDGGPLELGLDATTPRDAGGPMDAAIRDTGPEDTGPEDTGARPMCEPSQSFGLATEGIDEEGFEGVMTFLPTALIRLADASGRRRVVFGGALPEALFQQDTYLARVEVMQPFWSEARISLWRLGPGGGPTSLALVAWSGSAYGQGEVAELQYRYVPEGCEVTNPQCGTQEGLRLLVSDGGDAIPVDRGTRASTEFFPDDGFQAFNGRSQRYLEPPTCTDTPGVWYEGWIYRPDGGPQGCADMQRDDCIADSVCVLWGSEELDPGYRCLPAVGPCESVADPDDCRATASCTWDPGACYCPEGFECACGGGPAPKCRSRCGTFDRLTCPVGRFCEEASLEPPMCVQPPDGSGQCEWRPDTCAGVPSRSVCACTLNGPARFEHDCARRQARAGPADMAACP